MTKRGTDNLPISDNVSVLDTALNQRLYPLALGKQVARMAGISHQMRSRGDRNTGPSLGTAVFAGMIDVTLFGVLLPPVFYFVLEWFGRRHVRTSQANSLSSLRDGRESASRHGNRESPVNRGPG
jgi:hypothetical protein